MSKAYDSGVFASVSYRTSVAVAVTDLSACRCVAYRISELAAIHSLLLSKSCVDQKSSSTVAVNENPATGIKLSLYLFYVLAGLAEETFQLRGHAVEKDWANGRGSPRTVIVLNVDNDVESCGVLPGVKLKLVGLDSSLHD